MGYKKGNMGFQKGNTCGKGRPKTYDKASIIIESLDTDFIKNLLTNIKKAALGEEVNIDLKAAKMIFDILPAEKTFTQNKTIQKIQTESEVDTAMQDILTQVGTGDLSIESALDITTLIEKRGITLMKKEIAALEQEKQSYIN